VPSVAILHGMPLNVITLVLLLQYTRRPDSWLAQSNLSSILRQSWPTECHHSSAYQRLEIRLRHQQNSTTKLTEDFLHRTNHLYHNTNDGAVSSYPFPDRKVTWQSIELHEVAAISLPPAVICTDWPVSLPDAEDNLFPSSTTTTAHVVQSHYGSRWWRRRQRRWWRRH